MIIIMIIMIMIIMIIMITIIMIRSDLRPLVHAARIPQQVTSFCYG